MLPGKQKPDRFVFSNDAWLRYVPKRQRQSVNTYRAASRSWSMETNGVAERLYKHCLRMIGEMNRTDVKLLAGTDTAYGYPVAGFALHDELARVLFNLRFHLRHKLDKFGCLSDPIQVRITLK